MRRENDRMIISYTILPVASIQGMTFYRLCFTACFIVNLLTGRVAAFHLTNRGRTPSRSIVYRNEYPTVGSASFAASDSDDNELYAESTKALIPTSSDVIVIGAGLGGLCAAAILTKVYKKKVTVFESHYIAGGCAHAFDRKPGKNASKVKGFEDTVFTFDSGPTIVLGCSKPPYNPLRQVLNAVGKSEAVEWLRYDGWGMIVRENSAADDDHEWQRWKFPLGPQNFQSQILSQYPTDPAAATLEFEELRRVTSPLVSMGTSIPAMAMRADTSQLIPLLLRYPKPLLDIIKGGDGVTDTFARYMNGPDYVVRDLWLRNWLDALAFSLSGLEASRTPAAAMAYVLYDLHREGAALDYPRGGMGSIVEALVEAIQEDGVSRVCLRTAVERIDTDATGGVVGVTLANGQTVASGGVICNAPVWSLRSLLDDAGRQLLETAGAPPNKRQSINDDNDDETTKKGYLTNLDEIEQTRSFLHLHLALNATDLDLTKLEAHYTVMAQGLSDPTAELNMIAVSNPCVLDDTLAPPGTIVVHAYGAGNEPYHVWSNNNNTNTKLKRSEYNALKEQRAQVLWDAVESIIPDAKSRTILSLIGSPITHERYLRRPNGTYGAATEDLLPDGSTAIGGLVLCGDSIFPGIGVPAVAVNGAGAANAMVSVWDHWRAMDRLKDQGVL